MVVMMAAIRVTGDGDGSNGLTNGRDNGGDESWSNGKGNLDGSK